MRAILTLICIACFLAAPPAAATPAAEPEPSCEVGPDTIDCVFWAVVDVVRPDECQNANNFVTCTVLVTIDKLL